MKRIIFICVLTLLFQSLWGEEKAVMQGISAVMATKENYKVILSFKTDFKDKKYLVFRTINPIRTKADLNESSLIGLVTFNTLPFLDTPPLGFDFYYTVIDAQAYSEGTLGETIPITSELNTPIGFPLTDTTLNIYYSDPEFKSALSESSRPLPLPQIQVKTDPANGNPLPPSAWETFPFNQSPNKNLSKESINILQSFSLSPSEEPTLPFLTILPQETTQSPLRSAQTLAFTVNYYMVNKDWEKAKKQLQLLSYLDLDSDIESRIHFYISQCYAYEGDYKNGVLELLLADKLDVKNKDAWLSALLKKTIDQDKVN